jgi:excisionase family DNA binding protein
MTDNLSITSEPAVTTTSQILLSVKELAQMMGVSPRTALKLVRSGELPGFRLGQKLWRIRPEDVRTYLTSKTSRVHKGVSQATRP